MSEKPKRSVTPEHRAKISATLKQRNAKLRQEIEAQVAAEANDSPLSAFTKPLRKGKPGGKNLHREAVLNAKRLERQQRAWRLLVAGEGLGLTSFDDIGKALGVSGVTAWKDCLAVANRLNQAILTDAATYRAMQASELAAIKKAHWQKRHTKAGADVLIRTMEREAKLLNLDVRPPDNGYTAEQVLGLVKGMTVLFMDIVDDPEMRRRFAQGLRRQIGAPIDVEAVEEAS